jgi:hypothetical protein
MVDPLRPQYVPPPPPVLPPEKPGEKQHVVRENENLQQIADDHRTTPQSIQDINPQIRDPDLLATGEVLNIPNATVDPAVSRTVDAVLAPGATPEQRNEANVRVQDAVDAAGGVSDAGIAREALPAQAQGVLEQAGLPTIPKEVVASVDQVISPNASFDQRIAGYKAVAGYAESVGGVSDQGITAEYLPARASELLREAGTDVRLRSEVITATAGLLKDDATPAARDAAYATVQRYVDQVGGVGDAGIVADVLPAKAAQLLNDAGSPALRFDPRVTRAVNDVAGPAATDQQKLAGYQALQLHVDDVGGISDQGITEQYLPAKAAELLRERNVDVQLETPANASVDDVVRIMEAGATPADQLKVVNDAYARADASTRTALLADPQVQQTIRAAAFDAADPLTKPPEGADGQAVPFLKAAQNLDALTKDLDPALAGAVLENTAGLYAGYVRNDSGGQTGIEGSATFLKVLDRVAGTLQGDAAIKSLADTGIGLDRNGVFQHLSAGGTPAFLVQAGAHDAVLEGVQTYAGSTVKGSVDAYLSHTQELNWLVQNQGGVMTPDQLNRAIQDYMGRQEPGWETRANELKEQVAQDGLKLQTQIESMLAAGGYDGDVDKLLADPNNQFALTTAFGNHPEAVTDRTLSLLSGLGKTTESGRRTLEIAANAYVKGQVLTPLGKYDPADPRSAQLVQQTLAKLKSPGMATALGIDQPKLDQAVGALQQSLKGPNASQADLDGALGKLNRDLDGVALSKTTPAGQLFRSLGVGLAGLNLASSLQRAGRDPGELANWGKVVTDSLGVSQKTAEIMFARGAGGAGTEALASKAAGRIVSGLSAAADGWLSATAFAKGDTTLGTLYAVAAGGGALATAASLGAVGAWGGPVGVGLTAIAALTIFAVQGTRDSNTHMDDPDTAPFLAFSNLKPDVAKALTDQSGDGYSPVPVLQKYAELKGYDLSQPQDQQRFVTWLNDLPSGTLSQLRDGLHQKLDDWDGDANKLGTSTDVPQTEYDVNPSTGSATPRISVYTPGTVGEIDAFLIQHGHYAGGSVLPHA